MIINDVHSEKITNVLRNSMGAIIAKYRSPDLRTLIHLLPTSEVGFIVYTRYGVDE